jgi:hypothetical protein
MVRVSSSGSASFDEENQNGVNAGSGQASEPPPVPRPPNVAGLTPLVSKPADESARRKRVTFLSRNEPRKSPADNGDARRAVALLADAGRADVKLSVRDVACQLGFEAQPLARRSVDAVKGALPGAKSRSDRFRDVIGHQQQRAIWQHEERELGEQMSGWFEQLDGGQRASLDVTPAATGGPPWMQPLTLHTAGGSAIELDASHTLSWPADILAALPRETCAMLETRGKIWNTLGVESGPEAAALIDAHFERVTFDADGPLPGEVARLVELHPQMASTLRKLQQQGATLAFVRCTETPDTVLDAIRHIAVKSQHNFVSTWLPGLVAHDIEPEVTRDDVDAVRESSVKHRERALAKVDEDGFRGKVVARQFDESLDDDLDFTRSIGLIQTFSQSVMGVTATGADGASIRQLGALNRSLNDHFGREYARRRMIMDDANRTSEGAQTIIKSLAVMAPLVEVIQDVLHLGPVAQSLAAAGDDALSEGAEISALKGAGMTNEELRQRLKTIAPFGVLALGMAGSIDEVVQELGDHVGGALFSSSAVLLSFVTGALSIKYFADHYRQLEREDKLPPEMHLDARSRQQLDALSKVKLTKRELLKIVDTSLERSGAAPAERDALRARLARFSERRLMRRLRKEGALVPRSKAVVAGTKEAIGVNPARLGLMLGTLSSPAVGFALGPEFLHQPVLYAIAGSYETIVGALSIWAYGRSFDSRWKGFVRRREALEVPEDSDNANRPAT